MRELNSNFGWMGWVEEKSSHGRILRESTRPRVIFVLNSLFLFTLTLSETLTQNEAMCFLSCCVLDILQH